MSSGIASVIDNWDTLAAGSASSRVVKAAPGVLTGFFAVQTVFAAEKLLQYYDASAIPANGTFCKFQMHLAYTAVAVITEPAFRDLGEGLACATGICWASSDSFDFKTLSAGSPIWAVTHYR